MEIYKKILLPTDGSENNKIAVEHALLLAKTLNAELTALSVVDKSYYLYYSDSLAIPNLFPQLEEEGRKAVDYVLKEGEKRGMNVMVKVVDGHPADEIIKESKDYDLIVMGSLGRSGVPKLLMGSVAEKVVRFASCPVLVIRKS